MNEALPAVLTCAAGAGIGAIFFGGLWWTVHRGASSPRPARWFFGSTLLRMGIALAGFYYASDGRWERLLLCLLGFFMARVAITWLTRPAAENETRATQEASHAP